MDSAKTPALMSGPTSINGPQYLALLLAAVLGPGLFTFPADAVWYGPLDAWPAVAMAAAFSAVGFGAFIALGEACPRERLVAVFQRALGPAAGAAFALLLLLWDVGMAAAVLRSVGDLIHASFTFKTPISALAVTLLAASVYTASGGIGVVSRSLPIPIFVTMALFLGAMALGAPQAKYIDTVLPHMSSLGRSVESALVTFYVFTGGAQILNLRPFWGTRGGRVARWGWTAFILETALYTAVAILVFASLTPFETAHAMWPAAAVFRRITLPGFFLKRFGLFVIGAWSALVFTYLSFHLWAQAVILVDLVPALLARRVLTTYGLAAVVAVWGLSYKNDIVLRETVHDVYAPSGFLVMVILPVLLLAALRLKGPLRKPSEGQGRLI